PWPRLHCHTWFVSSIRHDPPIRMLWLVLIAWHPGGYPGWIYRSHRNHFSPTRMRAGTPRAEIHLNHWWPDPDKPADDSYRKNMDDRNQLLHRHRYTRACTPNPLPSHTANARQASGCKTAR